MGYVLRDHQYGKAESRLVRIYRDTPRHELRDLTVTTALRGDFDAAYTAGDQSAVLPTDTQKNTAYAFAKEHGVTSVEDFALTLARHFVADVAPVRGARVEVEEHLWDRAVVDGAEHDHTWVRRGQEVRTTAVTVDESGEHVVSGLTGLVILKSTGSEFAGFLRDEYTTLPETHDRVMATALDVHWRYAGTDVDWDGAYAAVRTALVAQFATVHSLALQQTLWHMGTAALDAVPQVVEIRLRAPNKHHFEYDVARFGLEQRGEVFWAADRPYGLIEATIARDDAPEAGDAWRSTVGPA